MRRNICRFNIFFFIILLFCCSKLVKNKASASVMIIYRDTWLTNVTFDNYKSTKLIRPVKYVVIDDLATKVLDSCDSITQCISLIQQLYNIHKSIWSDIGYNFLIGGDGTIYEGRGWFKQGFAIDRFNHLCLSVAYLGNFTDNENLKYKISNSLRFLMNKGREYRILKDNFKILTRPQIIDSSITNNKTLINAMILDSKFYNFISSFAHWMNGTVETSVMRISGLIATVRLQPL